MSASWLLSEESGIRGGFFDFLKLRASYGLTGNQAIENYPFQGLVTSANYGETPGIAPDNLPNPDLKWESTAQFNVGMDMAFAKGRVSLTADWYQKKTRDLLLSRPITATSGYLQRVRQRRQRHQPGTGAGPYDGQHRLAPDRRLSLDHHAEPGLQPQQGDGAVQRPAVLGRYPRA